MPSPSPHPASTGLTAPDFIVQIAARGQTEPPPLQSAAVISLTVVSKLPVMPTMRAVCRNRQGARQSASARRASSTRINGHPAASSGARTPAPPTLRPPLLERLRKNRDRRNVRRAKRLETTRRHRRESCVTAAKRSPQRLSRRRAPTRQTRPRQTPVVDRLTCSDYPLCDVATNASKARNPIQPHTKAQRPQRFPFLRTTQMPPSTLPSG